VCVQPHPQSSGAPFDCGNGGNDEPGGQERRPDLQASHHAWRLVVNRADRHEEVGKHLLARLDRGSAAPLAVKVTRVGADIEGSRPYDVPEDRGGGAHDRGGDPPVVEGPRDGGECADTGRGECERTEGLCVERVRC
jgi:hypothetical protein